MICCVKCRKIIDPNLQQKRIKFRDEYYHIECYREQFPSPVSEESTEENLYRCLGACIGLKNKYYYELATANATILALRDVIPSRGHWMHCCQCGRIMEPRPTLDIQECPNCFSMLQEIPGKIIDIIHPKQIEDTGAPEGGPVG